ncbi:hypothetical protein ACTMU2_18950 [Cupriavidus basilensis]
MDTPAAQCSADFGDDATLAELSPPKLEQLAAPPRPWHRGCSARAPRRGMAIWRLYERLASRIRRPQVAVFRRLDLWASARCLPIAALGGQQPASLLRSIVAGALRCRNVGLPGGRGRPPAARASRPAFGATWGTAGAPAGRSRWQRFASGMASSHGHGDPAQREALRWRLVEACLLPLQPKRQQTWRFPCAGQPARRAPSHALDTHEELDALLRAVHGLAERDPAVAAQHDVVAAQDESRPRRRW